MRIENTFHDLLSNFHWTLDTGVSHSHDCDFEIGKEHSPNIGIPLLEHNLFIGCASSPI